MYTPGFLTIDVTSISDPSAQYTWDFGDGTPQQNGFTAQHSYVATGSYTICCYMQTLCGTDSICKTVNITNVGLGENVITDLLVINRVGEWEIKSNSVIQNYSLMNAIGQVTYSNSNYFSNIVLNNEQLPDGIYLLQIRLADKIKVIKLKK